MVVRMSPIRAGVEVILVGPPRSVVLDGLGEALRDHGWYTTRVEALSDPPTRVDSRHKAVFVLHMREARRAMELLRKLDSKRHSCLVIVLAEHAEPGEYYCLMQAGAVQFFEIGEDPTRILQGIEWAAHVLAP